MDNKQLSDLVNSYILNNGISKVFIAEKLDISRQALDKLLNKKQFSLDDANRILKIVGYEITEVVIQKV